MRKFGKLEVIQNTPLDRREKSDVTAEKVTAQY